MITYSLVIIDARSIVNTLSVEEKLKIRKLVYKDFYTHHAFIDGDLQLSTARANKIILEYLGKTDTGTQRYQLHDKLVKELVCY